MFIRLRNPAVLSRLSWRGRSDVVVLWSVVVRESWWEHLINNDQPSSLNTVFIMSTMSYLELMLLILTIARSDTRYSEVISSVSSMMPEISVMVGGAVSLPCNMTSSVPGDQVRLVLWFRSDKMTPVYSLDSRGNYRERTLMRIFYLSMLMIILNVMTLMKMTTPCVMMVVSLFISVSLLFNCREIISWGTTLVWWHCFWGQSFLPVSTQSWPPQHWLCISVWCWSLQVQSRLQSAAHNHLPSEAQYQQ